MASEKKRTYYDLKYKSDTVEMNSNERLPRSFNFQVGHESCKLVRI